MKIKVFASWSGGKDGCLACYRAMNGGLDVSYLSNMVTEDGTRSCSHGMSSDIIRLQAEALGISLVQRKTTRETYEAEFKDMIRALKQEGVTGGVFGDIDFNEHRVWVDRVCAETGITPYLPLWEENQEKLIKEFVAAGFVSVIVAAKPEFFGAEVLGQVIDTAFINRLKAMQKTKKITLCGEAGEYHTLVVDGPLFRKKLVITETEKVLRNGTWFLEILHVEHQEKQ